MDDAAFVVMVLVLVEKKDTVVVAVAAAAAWRDSKNTREEDPSNVVVALFVRDEPRRNMTHPSNFVGPWLDFASNSSDTQERNPMEDAAANTERTLRIYL